MAHTTREFPIVGIITKNTEITRSAIDLSTKFASDSDELFNAMLLNYIFAIEGIKFLL
jgi:hypothetical protein